MKGFVSMQRALLAIIPKTILAGVQKHFSSIYYKSGDEQIAISYRQMRKILLREKHFNDIWRASNFCAIAI